MATLLPSQGASKRSCPCWACCSRNPLQLPHAPTCLPALRTWQCAFGPRWQHPALCTVAGLPEAGCTSPNHALQALALAHLVQLQGGISGRTPAIITPPCVTPARTGEPGASPMSEHSPEVGPRRHQSPWLFDSPPIWLCHTASLTCFWLPSVSPLMLRRSSKVSACHARTDRLLPLVPIVLQLVVCWFSELCRSILIPPP